MAVKQANPEAEVGLWSEDEARFGLEPIIKKRWSKVGTRPLAEVNPQYEWTWSYGAVEMATGESFFLLLPNLQSASVEIFLREFAKAKDLSREKIAILLWDGAPGAVESSRRHRVISDSTANAGVKPKRAIMVAAARSGRQSNICRD